MGKTSIRNCPFCGNNGEPDNLFVGDVFFQDQGGEKEKYHFVRCDCCQAAGPYATDEAAAILFWNERLDGHYFTYANLVLPEILHNLRAGTEKGIKLPARQCDDLLKVLGVSVTLETLIENIMTLCHTTLTNDPMTRNFNAVQPQRPVVRRYDDNHRVGKTSARHRATDVVSPPTSESEESSQKTRRPEDGKAPPWERK